MDPMEIINSALLNIDSQGIFILYVPQKEDPNEENAELSLMGGSGVQPSAEMNGILQGSLTP
jgi:hypothetical protein